MNTKKLYPYMAVEAVAMIAFAYGIMAQNTALQVGGFVLIMLTAFALSFALFRDARRRARGINTGSNFFVTDNDSSAQTHRDHPYAPNAPNAPTMGPSQTYVPSGSATPYAPNAEPIQPTQMTPPHEQDSAWGKGSSQPDNGPFHQGR